MRLTDLTISGYGIFHDCRVEDIPSGLTLFLGDNEAGKSTCLGFIRDVLFGFPDGRSRERTYPPLRGGRWGGSLGLTCRDFSRMVLDRGPGSKGGRLSLTGPQGESLSREALSRALGGTTREVFKNVYAFSLSEMQTLETLNSERVKDAIYSAGLGAGLSSLPDILKGVEDKRSTLFKSGGQRQRINSLLSRLEEVRAEIGRASGEIESYEEVVRELESLTGENERLKQELSELRGRCSRLSSVLSLWEEWMERVELVRELEGLPQVDEFPGDGLEQLEQINRKLEGLGERRRDLAGEAEDLDRRIFGLEIREEILEREQTVRGLAEEKGRFTEAGEEILRLEPEIKARQEDLQTVIKRLGGGWSREDLLAFDCSLKVKEDISRFAQSLQKLENRVAAASQSLQSRKEELSRAKEALEEADKELAAWKEGALEWDEDLALELRRDRDRFAQALEEAPALRQEGDRGRQEVERLLAEIDPSWTREDLERFDTSLQVRERIEQFRKGFAEKDRELLQLEQEIRSRREAAQELERKQRSRSQDLERMELPRYDSLGRIREVWSELQGMRRKTSQRENCRVREEALQNRIQGLERGSEALREQSGQSGGLTAAALAGLAGCGLTLGLAGAGQVPWQAAGFLAAVLGLMGLAFSGLSFREKRRLLKRGRELASERSRIQEERQARQADLEEARREKDRLDREIRGIQERLGLADSSGADSLEAELEQAREILQRRWRLEEELQGLTSEAEEAWEKVRALEGHREDLARSREELGESWRRELEGLGLSRELEPAATLRVLDRVETTRSELGHLRETEERLARLEEFIQDFAVKARRSAGDSELPSDRPEQLLSAVDRHLERVEQERERAKNRQLAEKERNRREKEHSRLEEERKRAEQELTEAESALEAERRKWRQWLEDKGLDPELTPDLAREALADIEKAQGLIAEERELEDKLERNQQRVRDFQERVRGLARELGRGEPQDRFLVPFVDTLEQELESSRANAGRKRELEAQRKEKENALREVAEDMEGLRQSLNGLLSQAGAADEEEFERKGRILERTREISSRLQELERNLTRGTGQSDMRAVEEIFSVWSREDLEVEIPRLEQEIEEMESRRQEVTGRMGQLRAEEDRLASADDISRLRQEEESLREELHQAALRWSEYTLAGYLLRKAKGKYEQEQQPEVVRTAGVYLSAITGGAYTGVFAPLGESEVYAVDAEGHSKRPEELSRGTAEQLYLSLRFGYVDNAGRQGERLPVIMDDILVNFDRSRAENAAAAIAELAERNQVLYFTCHSRSMELFRRVAPEAPVFRLNDGAIRRCDEPPA